MSNFLRLLRLLIGVAALGGSASAGTTPASTEPVDRLQEVVVSAAAFDGPVSRYPYAAVSLTREALSAPTVTSLPEALSTVTSVMNQKTAAGMESPYVRGFTGFRTLLYVDGFRFNNSVFREGPNQYWSTVDVLALEEITLLKGPQSARLGSDAVGGAGLASTPSPRFGQAGPQQYGRAHYRYASADRSHLSRVEAGGGLDAQTGVVAGFSRQTRNEVRGGHEVGRQPNTGTGATFFDLKVTRRLAASTRLTLAHQEADLDDLWRTHDTPYGLTWEKLTRGTNLVRTLANHRRMTYVRLTSLPGNAVSLDTGFCRLGLKEDEHRQRANRTQERQGFAVITHGAFLRASGTGALGQWETGADVYEDRVGSYFRQLDADGLLTGTRVQGPVADGAKVRTAGLYVQDRVRPGARTEVTASLRVDHSRLTAARVALPAGTFPFSLGRDTAVAAGSVRILHRLSAPGDWRAFAGLSQGVRVPNLSDLTRFDIAASGQVETPSAALAPEHYLNAEVGWRGSSGQVRTELAVFRTWIDAMIVRTPTGRQIGGLAEVTKRNSGSGFIHGLEAEGEIQLTGTLSLKGSFTWMQGILAGYPTAATVLVREPVSRLMPATGAVAATWRKQAWTCAAHVIVAGAARRLSAADRADNTRIPPGGTPGYATLGLRAGYRCLRWLSLSASLENLTNEDYRIHGSGLNEPGRNLILSVRLDG